MKPILEIQGVGKQYKIGGAASTKSFRDQIVNTVRGQKQEKKDSFWALKDISFDVYAGESIGIIGRNGAGKSTLLKILSKITPPTEGQIIARGRVASLLEVGTGFHSELTGRENIYLNGSILGLSRAEIDRQFDTIVDFSGVETFLETPLKHYSSGMSLRLAFAVAAHLEPEILVIDEVLAVGDAAFQKKCIGKMNEVSKSGRTVLFVSHNMGSVIQLCPKSVLLNKGHIEKIGPSTEIIEHYFQTIKANTKMVEQNDIVENFELVDVEEGFEGRKFVFELSINNNSSDDYTTDIIVKYQGQKIIFSSMEFFGFVTIPPGKHKIKSTIGPVNLLIGEYQFDLLVNVPRVKRLVHLTDVISYEVDYLHMENKSHGKLPVHSFGYMGAKQSWKILD